MTPLRCCNCLCSPSNSFFVALCGSRETWVSAIVTTSQVNRTSLLVSCDHVVWRNVFYWDRIEFENCSIGSICFQHFERRSSWRRPLLLFFITGQHLSKKYSRVYEAIEDMQLLCIVCPPGSGRWLRRFSASSAFPAFPAFSAFSAFLVEWAVGLPHLHVKWRKTCTRFLSRARPKKI